ncbi:hypothetical protein ACLBWZ_17340 [Brucellaceae bacterium C25G]
MLLWFTDVHMKRYALIACSALLPLFITALLFTGIETQHREHNTDYIFFIKQQPSLQLFFVNPIACGECDIEIYEKLPLSRIEEIRNYCQQRFGLNELRMCHAIFAESQRQARVNMQNLDAINLVAARFINNSNIENDTNFLFPSVNSKTVVPECVLPLSVKWRTDTDKKNRIIVSCEETNHSELQNRWDVTLPIFSN